MKTNRSLLKVKQQAGESGKTEKMKVIKSKWFLFEISFESSVAKVIAIEVSKLISKTIALSYSFSYIYITNLGSL